jgi:hypothetical protein
MFRTALPISDRLLDRCLQFLLQLYSEPALAVVVRSVLTAMKCRHDGNVKFMIIFNMLRGGVSGVKGVNSTLIKKKFVG